MGVRISSTINIDYGERIHIPLAIRAINTGYDLPFSIIEASWQLLIRSGMEAVASGECSIAGHVIDALVEPPSPGRFILRYTYKIADEVWVDNFRVEVG